jgi:hypothetical protein
MMLLKIPHSHCAQTVEAQSFPIVPARNVGITKAAR